jgi:hypothetical protein
MSSHLSEEQFVAYVHQALDDARREAMDQHLAGCLRCRARLADHESLRRRIRQDLLADLRAARPSPRMNYAAISSRLPGRGAFVWLRMQFTRLFSGAAALAAVALQSVILLALLGGMNQPVAGAMMLPGQSRPAGPGQPACAGELPPAWFVAVPPNCDYQAGLDLTVSHTGQASGVVRSKASAPGGVGTLMQVFAARDYRGQRIRVSAYVRAEDVMGWAALWVRVGDSKYQLSYFDRRLDGLSFSTVAGTTDWARHEIVLDVPQDGGVIALGISLEGTGHIWLDDVQIQVE